MGTGGFLDPIDLGAAATDDPAHQRVGHRHLHRPTGQDSQDSTITTTRILHQCMSHMCSEVITD